MRAIAPWMTVGDLLVSKIEERPNAVVAEFDSTLSITRTTLAHDANRAGQSLLRHGVTVGDRVATLMTTRYEQVVLLFACARIGALFAPLNTSLGEWDLSRSLAVVEPTVLVVEASHPLRGRLPARSSRVTIVVDGEGRDGFSHLLEDGPHLSWPVVTPDMGVSLMFTGGTSGLPKAVVRSHYSYISSGHRYGQMMQPAPTDRHVSVSQFFHGSGQEVALMGPLMADIPTSFARTFDADQYVARCLAFGGTLGEIYGAMLLPVLDALERSGSELGIRAFVGGTAGASPELVRSYEQRTGAQVLPVYASTETGMLLFANTVKERRDGAAGKNLGWCEVQISDEFDRGLPVGDVGEILLRPTVPHSMGDGYFRADASTVERRRNLWLHTGDLGRVDADGWLYFEGRQIHFVRRKGENISVTEIEQFLAGLEGLRESCLIGLDSDSGDQETLVVVVSEVLEPTEVIAACKEGLARFKVPDYVAVVEELLPRSATKGEIERHKVRLPDGRAWSRRREGYVCIESLRTAENPPDSD